MSISTSNGYLTALKGFCKWLVKDRRTGIDALAHLPRLNAKPDIRRQRRALPLPELQRILAAAQTSTEVYRSAGCEQTLKIKAFATNCDGLRRDGTKGERGDLNPQPPEPQSGALTS